MTKKFECKFSKFVCLCGRVFNMKNHTLFHRKYKI